MRSLVCVCVCVCVRVCVVHVCLILNALAFRKTSNVLQVVIFIFVLYSIAENFKFRKSVSPIHFEDTM